VPIAALPKHLFLQWNRDISKWSALTVTAGLDKLPYVIDYQWCFILKWYNCQCNICQRYIYQFSINQFSISQFSISQFSISQCSISQCSISQCPVSQWCCV
jgi:hypothetical protein